MEKFETTITRVPMTPFAVFRYLREQTAAWGLLLWYGKHNRWRVFMRKRPLSSSR